MSPVVIGGVDTDQANTHAYLNLLFGTADTGFLPVWTLEDKTTAWFAVTDLADAAAYITEQSRFGNNVYIGMGIQAAPLGPHRRGEAATVIAIACGWDDHDIAGPAHTRTALPASVDAVLAVLNEFPLRPTVLVHSGHGIYPLWLFKEVWMFASADERRRAGSLVARVQLAIRIIARRHGYDFETTSDLARVLRPVGATNLKPDLPPAPVTLLHDSGLRYGIEEIEDVLPDEAQPSASRRAWSGGAEPQADLARILAGCAFMRHCRDDAATLDEPSWHAMLSIVARCRDGEQAAHDLSASYPHYDRAETDKKFAYALAANKPLRCSTIRDDRGGLRYCIVCPNAGRIGSPVVLGEPIIGVPRIGRPLKSKVGHLTAREGVAHVG